MAVQDNNYFDQFGQWGNNSAPVNPLGNNMLMPGNLTGTNNTASMLQGNNPTDMSSWSRMGQGHPSAGGYAGLGAPKVPGVISPKGPEFWDKGGKFSTIAGAAAAAGQFYLGSKQLAQGDRQFDWQSKSFNDQYQAKRSLINDEMRNQQVLAGRERGQSIEEAEKNADAYVIERGVQQSYS